MKHPTSRLLHAYWDRLRGQRAAPERGEIEPGAIRNLLADSLILEIDPAQAHAAFRLAGTRLCALFGRELRGTAFADLWGGDGPASQGRPGHGSPHDPSHAASHPSWPLVGTVALDTLGVVAGLRGFTGRDDAIDLELLLLPLRHRGRTQARMLGALAPHCVPAWLGLEPVVRLEQTSLRVLDARPRSGPGRETAEGFPAALPVPANDALPVRRGHLLVHRGGLG